MTPLSGDLALESEGVNCLIGSEFPIPGGKRAEVGSRILWRRLLSSQGALLDQPPTWGSGRSGFSQGNDQALWCQARSQGLGVWGEGREHGLAGSPLASCSAPLATCSVCQRLWRVLRGA